MRRILLSLLTAVIFAATAVAGYAYFRASHSSAPVASKFVAPPVARGEIKLTVNSTGNVQPVQSVQVGSYISGQVKNVLVNFNDRVAAGQLLAQVDPRIYEAAVAHEEAALTRCKAELARIKALWTQAVHKEERGKLLQAERAISASDVDVCIAERATLDAQLQITEALIHESEASLTTARTNLEFTNIKSPVDGIVIERKIDPGQTVASLFQAPALFIIAPDLEKRVDVYASVKEDDIIHVREAKERNEPVTFSVNAYPDDVFQGRIMQIRLTPTTIQNSVHYTVIVEAPNKDFKLLPGMTANMSFEIDRRTNVPIIPASALQFSPRPEQVRECDRTILESIAQGSAVSSAAIGGDSSSSSEFNPARVNGHVRKYVWVPEGDLLMAVPIEIGLRNQTSAEVVSSRLAPGQEVVVGLRPGVEE